MKCIKLEYVYHDLHEIIERENKEDIHAFISHILEVSYFGADYLELVSSLKHMLKY